MKNVTCRHNSEYCYIFSKDSVFSKGCLITLAVMEKSSFNNFCCYNQPYHKISFISCWRNTLKHAGFLIFAIINKKNRSRTSLKFE